MAGEFNQEERSRRLREAIRAKQDQLARRRAARAAAASGQQLQNVAAVALMAATAAWLAGFSPEWIAALGLIGQAFAALSDIQPLFLGVAVGCLFAGFHRLHAQRDESEPGPAPQPATLMLWLGLLFLALSLLPFVS